jgi:hypothetical protein
MIESRFWWYYSYSPNLTMETCISNLDKNLSWKAISMNQSITMEDVREHPLLPWYWAYLSCNPNLTTSFVLENMDKPWEWGTISKNTFVTSSKKPDYPQDV